MVPPEAPAFRTVSPIVVVAPAWLKMPPPVRLSAELPLRVLFFTVEPLFWAPFQMPPPLLLAELPLMVLLVTVKLSRFPPFQMPPPPLLPDELPLMVLLVTASVAPELLLMPPPLSLPTRLAELLMMLLRSVRPPSLRMPPPPLPVASNPLVTVKPEMVTVEPKFSNTRNVALPLTARLGAPGPEMVILWLTVSSPVVRVIVPVTAKVIVSPSFAML